MPLAYIALGSNLGDRLGQMRQALQHLTNGFGVEVLATSTVYQNRAVGMGESAADFLNAVAKVSSPLGPFDLLQACLDIEQKLGRTRSDHGWVSRTIDLDLLAYEGVTLENERLTLPHPRICERDFVAVPLAELAPELEIGGCRLPQIVAELAEYELALHPERL